LEWPRTGQIPAPYRLGLAIDLGGRFHSVARQAGAAFEFLPAVSADGCDEFGEAVGMLSDELDIEHA
jgi:hypothetical protein